MDIQFELHSANPVEVGVRGGVVGSRCRAIYVDLSSYWDVRWLLIGM